MQAIPPLAVIILVALAAGIASGQSGRAVEIRSTDLGHGVHLLEAPGGNMGLCVGDDGVLLIDARIAPLPGRVAAKIATLTDKPVEFVVHTHWHEDATVNDESRGEAGAVLVAHENARRRIQRVTASTPAVTFRTAMTFHWNDEEVRLVHVPRAHTDGDALVYFMKADVLHMGDTFHNGAYPYIDASSGGTIDGMLRAIDVAMLLAGSNTKIIPGHGPLATHDDLDRYKAMLTDVRARVRERIDAGDSREAIVAAGLTKDYDETWGNGLKPDAWIGTVYDAMKP